MKIKKYEKKPDVITVLQYDGQNQDEMREFCGENLGVHCDTTTLVTLDEQHIAIGSYATKTENGGPITVMLESRLKKYYDRAPNFEKEDEDGE